MNLAVRAIDSTQVVWNNEGSFLRDAFPNLKVQYILANPPFNDSDWARTCSAVIQDGNMGYHQPAMQTMLGFSTSSIIWQIMV